MCFISTGKEIQATFDAWFLGDDFLQETYHQFQKIINIAAMKKKDMSPPYLTEYYNTKPFYKENSGGINHLFSRIVNTFMYALNKCEQLPHFIVIIPDCDLVKDVIEIKNPGELVRALEKVTHWMVKQIRNLRSQKRLQLMERKPGSVYSGDPKVIFMRMLRRPISINDSSVKNKVCSWTSKFNYALNEVIAETELNIMTIVSCNSPDHFDRWGNLSDKGK